MHYAKGENWGMAEWGGQPVYQCFLLEDFALFDGFVKHVQALNASSRAALMLKLDRSGTATRYLLCLS
jgi:hypothetical protein